MPSIDLLKQSIKANFNLTNRVSRHASCTAPVIAKAQDNKSPRDFNIDCLRLRNPMTSPTAPYPPRHARSTLSLRISITSRPMRSNKEPFNQSGRLDSKQRPFDQPRLKVLQYPENRAFLGV